MLNWLPSSRRTRLCACICLPLGAFAILLAQELRVENVTLDSTGQIHVRHTADPASYYILYRGAEVTRIVLAADLALGVAGVGELSDRATVSSEASAFYRIRKVPIDQPLDTDGDGIDDVYELRNPDILKPLDGSDAALDFDADGASNLDEYRRGTDPRLSVPLATVTSSPFNGETGVAVTRETVVRFSAALKEDAVIGLNQLYAEFGGRRLLGRVEVASDRKSATLFYLENLPGSARVQVFLDANNLKDARGLLVDADGDGAPGGVGLIEFDTLSITEVAATAVIGRVFSSELLIDAGGQSSSINRPLVGATITVDGREETLRAGTDAMGNFKLEPVPAGRFFVHVDGRTADGSAWPGGAYYPVVGKAWEAVAGRADNLAGGTGEVYLPLIVPGSLQPISQTQATPITFPKEVLDKNAALAGVTITVPANSLFSENGARGGMVGIAPVPPDRLPEKLPPGLNFPLVITVQTDGPSNFDRPVPVRFPNLPDPATGQKLPPGAKSALWSFNHDTGQWEIVGPMTVTEDGNFVESDAGFGILQPGWHGSQSGTSTSGPEGSTKNPCEGLSTRKIIDNVVDLGVGAFKCAAEFAGLRDSLKKALSIAAELKKLVDNAQKLYDDAKAGRDAGTARNTMKVILNGKKIVIDAIESFKEQSLFAKISKIAKCAESILSALDGVCGRTVKGGDGPCGSSVWVRLVCIGISEAKTIVAALNREAEAFEQSLTKAAIKTACLLIDIVSTQLGLLPEGAALHNSLSKLADSDPVPPEVIAQMEEMLQSVKLMDSELLIIGQFAQRALDFDAKIASITQNIANFYTEQIGLPGRAHYLIEIAGQKIRGKTDERGQIREILAPNADYSLSIYDHYNGRIGVVNSRTAPNGFPTEIPVPLFELPENTNDADGDALLDIFENVVGTELNKSDTDSDGIRDGAEVQQGTDPLSGLAARTGMVASIQTPGNAVDICAVNNLALIAAESAGLIVCNIFNGLNPVVIAQVDTPGTATRVACAGNLAAVADGLSGLAIIDIGNPSSARITQQVILGNSALSVTTLGSVAFVGLNSGEVVAVDMLTGTVLHRHKANLAVQDLAWAGAYLFALTDNTLHVLSYEDTQFTAISSISSPFVAGQNRRLFVGGNVAYAIHGKGYNTFDVADPRSPKLLKASNTAQFGWRQIALNGTGLGVAVVNQNAGFDGPNDVSLYNTADPLKTDQFITTFPTPGVARAVSIFDGIAYVADGPSGLAVINYLAYDTQNQPPTVSLVTNDPDGVIEEGKPLTIRAEAADDVQVRRVEFLVDGTAVATDGNFPFEHQLITPKILAGDDTFTIQATATDTGGNSTASAPLTIKLVPDATPPRIARFIPTPGSGVAASRRVAAYFNEPVNLDTIPSANFFVAEAGPDGRLGTPDDVVLSGGTFSFDETLNAVFLTFPNNFGLGTYQAVVRNVADLAGNRLVAEESAQFFAGMGLTGEYYGTTEFTDLRLARLDGSVDFDWGTGSPDPVVGNDVFSVRWRGFVVPRFSEEYTFFTMSDDGVRLWLDDELLIDNWTVHAVVENSSRPVRLVAGQRYRIQMEFFENFIFAVARLRWSSASQAKEPIRAGQLFPYEDSTPPILLAAEPDRSFRRVRLQFSEPLEAKTANDFANYSFSGGVSVTSGELQSNGTDVLLTTSRLAEATRYTITVNGVRDASERANVIAAGSQIQFTSYAIVSGSLRREVYQQITGGLLSDLVGSAKFPNAPDVSDFVSSFEAPSNSGDNYGQRLSGFVVPPVTGAYVFYLSADDQAALYLSTDEDPAKAVLIASEP
ncbi:MAG: PA14 domain-containing protein, partial [Verrucomicrobiales bacterium]|nr:PA14 domain-containing protein [Verrucomicrobiales bacterium]